MDSLEDGLKALQRRFVERHECLKERINRLGSAGQDCGNTSSASTRAGRSSPTSRTKLQRQYAKSDEAMRKWFGRLCAYLRAFQLDGRRDFKAMLLLAASQLFDNALESWWQSGVEETRTRFLVGFGSVEALAEAAFKQSSGRDLADAARDELDKVRQNGSARSYANIAQGPGPPHRTEGDSMNTFKRGLMPASREVLALQKPTSLAQVKEMALEVEAAQTTTRPAGLDTMDVQKSELLPSCTRRH